MSGMHEHLADGIGRGAVSLTLGRGGATFRWGISPDLVLWTASESEPWLAVRRVYEHRGSMEWHETATRWGWAPDEQGKDRFQQLGGGNIGRVGSRARLVTILRSLAKGEIAGSGDSYIEVLPWREDGSYAEPLPFAEAMLRIRGSVTSGS